MGTMTQFFEAINAEKYPSKLEQRHHYTHINLQDPAISKLIKRLRRERKRTLKQKTKE